MGIIAGRKLPLVSDGTKLFSSKLGNEKELELGHTSELKLADFPLPERCEIEEEEGEKKSFTYYSVHSLSI